MTRSTSNSWWRRIATAHPTGIAPKTPGSSRPRREALPSKTAATNAKADGHDGGEHDELESVALVRAATAVAGDHGSDRGDRPDEHEERHELLCHVPDVGDADRVVDHRRSLADT